MAVLFLLAQGLFLGVFVVRRLSGQRSAGPDAPRAQARRAAPKAWGFLILHGAGLAFVSLGIWLAFVESRAHMPSSLRTVLGVVAVVAAAALAMWALRVFASWRLLAHVDVGHALCVEGPYRLVRHPIYLALDLWAVGSAAACPNVFTITGAVVAIVGGDLRSRAEERLLLDVFGEEYRAYMQRVRRLLPGIY